MPGHRLSLRPPMPGGPEYASAPPSPSHAESIPFLRNDVGSQGQGHMWFHSPDSSSLDESDAMECDALPLQKHPESLLLQVLGIAPSPYPEDNEVVHRDSEHMQVGAPNGYQAGRISFPMARLFPAGHRRRRPASLRRAPNRPADSRFVYGSLEDNKHGKYVILFKSRRGDHILLMNRIYSSEHTCLDVCFHCETCTYAVRKAYWNGATEEQAQRGHGELRILGHLESLPRPEGFEPAVSQLLEYLDYSVPGTTRPAWSRVSYWRHYNLTSIQKVHEAYTRNKRHTVAYMENGNAIELPSYKYVPRVMIAKFVFDICSTLEWMYTASSPVFHFDLHPENCFAHWNEGDALPRAVIGGWGHAALVCQDRKLSGHLQDARGGQGWITKHRTPPPCVHPPAGRHMTDVKIFRQGIELMVATPHLGLDKVQDVYDTAHVLQPMMLAMRDFVEVDTTQAETDINYENIPSLGPIIEAAYQACQALMPDAASAEISRMKQPLANILRGATPQNPFFFVTKKAATKVHDVLGPFRVAEILPGTRIAVDTEEHCQTENGP